MKYPTTCFAVIKRGLSISVNDEASHYIVWKVGNLSFKNKFQFVGNFIFECNSSKFDDNEQNEGSIGNTNSDEVAVRSTEKDNKVHDDLADK